MKTIQPIFIIFLFLSTVSTGQTPDSLKFKSLPPTEFLAAYQKSGNSILADVREFFEYKKSRITDAVNIPSSGNLEIAADTIDKNKDLFLYCTSGFRSKRVAKYFSGKGFISVYSLEGGIIAWRKCNLPVNKKKLRR
jgi:thioredoxin 1